MTFISNKAIRKLYVNLCVVDLRLWILTILLTASHKFSTTATFVLGYSRKNPHPPTDGILEILAEGGGQRPWKSRREGGLNWKKSSAGVISTDSSRDSNV